MTLVLLFLSLASPKVEVIPEYGRTLEHVLISVPTWYGSEDGTIPRDYLLWLYREVIQALPEYSEILVAVSPEDRPRIQDMLKEEMLKRPITLHVMSQDAKNLELDQWAQDLGEPMMIGSEMKLLVSMRGGDTSSYNSRLSQHRFEAARQLFGDRLIEADFLFEGGNFAFDEIEGKHCVFVGYNDVHLNLEHHNALGRQFTQADVLRKISRQFDDAEVVAMGEELQSPYIRHLDQAFILLEGKIAIVNRVLAGEASAEARQLRAYAKQLEQLGYRTLKLSNTAEEIRGYRNSLNAVPFVDRRTGSRKVIFPVFPGEVSPGHEGRLEKSKLQGKALRAYELFELIGYAPVPVRDFAFVAGGNTHCIINVLE